MRTIRRRATRKSKRKTHRRMRGGIVHGAIYAATQAATQYRAPSASRTASKKPSWSYMYDKLNGSDCQPPADRSLKQSLKNQIASLLEDKEMYKESMFLLSGVPVRLDGSVLHTFENLLKKSPQNVIQRFKQDKRFQKEVLDMYLAAFGVPLDEKYMTLSSSSYGDKYFTEVMRQLQATGADKKVLDTVEDTYKNCLLNYGLERPNTPLPVIFTPEQTMNVLMELLRNVKDKPEIRGLIQVCVTLAVQEMLSQMKVQFVPVQATFT